MTLKIPMLVLFSNTFHGKSKTRINESFTGYFSQIIGDPSGQLSVGFIFNPIAVVVNLG